MIIEARATEEWRVDRRRRAEDRDETVVARVGGGRQREQAKTESEQGSRVHGKAPADRRGQRRP